MSRRFAAVCFAGLVVWLLIPDGGRTGIPPRITCPAHTVGRARPDRDLDGVDADAVGAAG